jgi:hypothetical protein
MTLSILAISALSSFTLLVPGGEMSKQTLVSIPEGNQIEVAQRGTEAKQANLIEVAQRGTENVAFTYSMDKQADELNERVAANKSVNNLEFAFLPQPERIQSATLAVYRGNDDSSTLHSVRTPEQVATSTSDRWTIPSPGPYKPILDPYSPT